jgi:hypothetical protein
MSRDMWRHDTAAATTPYLHRERVPGVRPDENAVHDALVAVCHGGAADAGAVCGAVAAIALVHERPEQLVPDDEQAPVVLVHTAVMVHAMVTA